MCMSLSTKRSQYSMAVSSGLAFPVQLQTRPDGQRARQGHFCYYLINGGPTKQSGKLGPVNGRISGSGDHAPDRAHADGHRHDSN